MVGLAYSNTDDEKEGDSIEIDDGPKDKVSLDLPTMSLSFISGAAAAHSRLEWLSCGVEFAVVAVMGLYGGLKNIVCRSRYRYHIMWV